MEHKAEKQWERGIIRSVAAEVRERILSGMDEDFLPGLRQMAKTLSVSVPTLSKALHLLADEGVLLSGGNRRRWQVRPAAGNPHGAGNGHPSATGRPKRVLFLASHSGVSRWFYGMELLSTVGDELSKLGYELVLRLMDFTDAKKPRKAWDEILKLERPDFLLVLGGTGALAEWAVRHGIRTMFIGGNPGNSGIAVVYSSVATMLKMAVRHLTDLGHRRILFPLCGRTPEFVAGVRSALNPPAGPDFSQGCLSMVESGYSSPQIFVDLMRRQWRKTPPDALIFLDWWEFIAAESFLNQSGIVIPRDVSVIVLSQNPTMDWHLPPISHFQLPVAPLVREVAKWLRTGVFVRTHDRGKEYQARWIPKESVLARKPQKGN